MTKNRYDDKQRPSVILDAGYVSIRADDVCKSSKIIGLHGRKLICIILTIFILFLISFINLTCLVWIMWKLDWSPFHKNGSKVFQFDRINDQIELYHQGIFNETIYTTQIKDLSPIDFLTTKQMDVFGDHNSILFDNNQISMNTEDFYMNDKFLVDFNNLQLFKFDEKRKTKVHLDRLNSQHIHSNCLNLTSDNYLTISNVNKVFFSGQNLTIEANRNNRRSILRFNNNPKRKKSSENRQKTTYGNIDFRIDSIYLDLPRLPSVENTHHSESSVYRVCICNTTFLLLRSFAHQPCPLC